jgi:hypothetical protein
VVFWVHSRRSLTCGYENTAFQAEKKILLLNSYKNISDSTGLRVGNHKVGDLFLKGRVGVLADSESN